MSAHPMSWPGGMRGVRPPKLHAASALAAAWLAAACAGVAPATGQETRGVPGEEAARAEGAVVVHSLYRCPPEHLAALRTFYRERAAPVLRRQVEAGLLTDWRVLAHAWGDEWNWVVTWTATSWTGFLEAHGAFAEETGEEALREVHGPCPAHRDDVYRVVAGPEPVGVRIDPRDPVP